MKYSNKGLPEIGDRRMVQVLRLSLVTLLAFLISNGAAQSFNGFASYQAYLDNYYGQSAYQSAYQTPTPIRTVTYTPNTTTTPYYTQNTRQTVQTIQTNNTSPYNGFASYQDYLDNFYAGQNVPSPSVDPCGFAQTMSIFVSPNNDCAPVNNARIVTQPVATTTAFNGYPSYEAYLDAFYAGQVAPQQTTPQQTTAPVNNSVTSGFYGYNSYEEYLAAFYAVQNTTPPATTTPNSGYNVNYTVTQTTPPAAPTPEPSSNVSGYFDFVIGQAYQFSNGLIMTVETLTDSRCPQGVQCVWQGEIAAVVRLELDTEDRRVNISIVNGQQAPQIVVADASVQFVGLGDVVDNANTLKAYVILN